MNMVHGQVLVALALTILFDFICSTSSTKLIDEKRLQQIEAIMKPDTEACGNFAEYACGPWDTERAVNFSSLYASEQNETDQVLQYLHHYSEPKFLRQIYNYYVSYTEVEEVQPLEYLKWMSVYENFKWPLGMGNSADEQKHNQEWGGMEWIEMLARLRKFGLNDIFIHEDITQRHDDPYKSALVLKIPLGAPLADSLQHQLDDLIPESVDEETLETLDKFQNSFKTLYYHSKYSEEANILESNDDEARVTLQDLRMPWLNRYLEVLLDQNEVDPNMQLYVQSVDYLRSMYDFVSDYGNRLVCDYIQLKFLLFLMEDEYYRGYYRLLVVGNIINHFPLAMQWLYRRTHPELEQEVPVITKLFSNLKSTFSTNLNYNAYHFSVHTLEYMQAKIDSLQLLVFDKSTEEVDQYYEQLNLLCSEYYGNRLRLNRFKFNVSHSTLDNVFYRSAMQYLDFRPPGTPNGYPLPYLYPRLNIIFLPRLIMQDPYYHQGLTAAYTYSSLGYLLAREIVKAFDSRYLLIDANGIYSSNTSSINDEIQLDSGKLDVDVQAINEVIDDIAGLKLAYDSFAEFHPDVLTETFNMHNRTFTMAQVFFLNYAYNFCFTLDFSCKRLTYLVMYSGAFNQAFGCRQQVNEDDYTLWPPKNF